MNNTVKGPGGKQWQRASLTIYGGVVPLRGFHGVGL